MLFLYVKMQIERFDQRFQTLQTNKQGTTHLVSVSKIQNDS